MEVSNMCRSCMKDLAASENNFNQNTLKMFAFCTSIEVLEDLLPQKFCSRCSTAIEYCCNFITLARKIDKRLKKFIATSKAIKPEIIDFNEPDIKTDSDTDTLMNHDLVYHETHKTIPKSECEDKKRRKEKKKSLKKLHKTIISVSNEKPTKSEINDSLETASSCNDTKPIYKSELQCPFCNKVFLRKRNALKQHIADHLKNAMSVQKTRFDHLKNAMSVQKPRTNKHRDYFCKVCQRSFSRKKNYENHMLVFHQNNDIKQGTSNSTEENVTCNSCDKSFSLRSDLLEHIALTHLRYPCALCSMTFPTALELYRHKRSHSTRRYDCPHCPLQFPKRRQYTEHVRSHLGPVQSRRGPLRYTCDHCNKSFRFKSDIRYHLQIHDSTLKPILCDICGSRFSFKRALLDHRRVHTGEKPYRCEQCGYTCATSGNMGRHVRAHAQERKHQCVQCGKAFTEANYLKTHMLWHTGERPYKCPHCDRRYMGSSKRKAHMVRAHGLDPSAIPRLSMEGGPARRYVTSGVRDNKNPSLLRQGARDKMNYSLLGQRTKEIEENDLPDG